MAIKLDDFSSAPRPRAAVIVAHPHDETLWCGGYILTHPEFLWRLVTFIQSLRCGPRSEVPRSIAALRDVAAGRMDVARRRLLALTELVKPWHENEAEWGFNEWIKAQTGQPSGRDWQTWPAAM
jgi:hypothetical protein